MLGFGRSLLSRLLLNWAIFSLLVFFTLPATVDLPLAAFGIGGSRGMSDMPDRASSINFGLDGLTSRRARQILLAGMSRLMLKSRNRRCWHECYAALAV